MTTNNGIIPIEQALEEIRNGTYLNSDCWDNDKVAEVVKMYYDKARTDTIVKRTPAELKEDLECFDLEIVYNDDNTLYVRTLEDRSVGIFGEILSPTFKNIDGLISWWDTINGIFFGIM